MSTRVCMHLGPYALKAEGLRDVYLSHDLGRFMSYFVSFTHSCCQP